MQLGALIRRLEDEADAARAIEAQGDAILYSRVEAMGRLHDESPGGYLAGAVRRFAHHGSDDDWLALMTSIERADDPARAVMVRILHWALDKDAGEGDAPGCSCGSDAGDRCVENKAIIYLTHQTL